MDATLIVTLFVAALAVITVGLSLRAARAPRGGAADHGARLAAAEALVAERTIQVGRLQTQLDSATQENTDLRQQVTRAESALQAEREQLERERGFLAEAKAQLNDSFQSLSAQALEKNTERFLLMAKTQFESHQSSGKVEHARRVEQFGELVKPLKDTLASVDKQFTEIERARVGSYEALKTQVADLHKTTGTLSSALRSPKARGRWGELHLQRVVELAGLREHVDFEMEVSTSGDSGTRRPDMVVRMPGGGQLIVDAKTPFDSFERALAADEGEDRDQLLMEHARRVREHVKELSSKRYLDRFEQTPEFVVLFIPGEAMFAAAVDADASLLEFAAERNVHIASPVTLISIFRGVAHGWRQEELAQNARVVSKLGKDLYDRIDTLVKHWGTLAKHLTNAVGSYNDGLRSVETRLLPTARKLAALHVEAGEDDVRDLEPINVLPLTATAAEITAAVSPYGSSMADQPLTATVLARPEP